MAEAFGLAASVLSVASLAIQLGDSLQKAYEIWRSIEDAPDDIRRISTELRWLANCFDQIQREHSASVIDPLQEQLVRGAFHIAKRDVDKLAGVVAELSRVIGSDQKRTRRWGRVKLVLKSGTIAKMQEHIESSKSILTLLQTSRTQSIICEMNGKLDLLNASFSTVHANDPEKIDDRLSVPPPYHGLDRAIRARRSVENHCSEQTNESQRTYGDSHFQVMTSSQTIDAGLGILTLRSKSAKAIGEKGEGDCATKIFTVSFLWRFASCRRCFRLNTSNNFDSWSFNTIRTRPSDSLIFELCRAGNAIRVGDLLRYGRTSVFDADPDGATLLHYACKYGHSNLVQLLVSAGADLYARTDVGDTRVNYLDDYDKHQDVQDRHNIAKIVDTMMRYGDFDPFDFEDQEGSFDALTLWNGLPYENLRHIFVQLADYATPEQRFDFTLGNLLQLRDSVELSQECVDLLLVEYEKLRSCPIKQHGWYYNFTLLQHLVFHWLDRNEGFGRRPGLKISAALRLTNDLWRRDREGTVLDTVARYDGSMVKKWLRLLFTNGVNLFEYGEYEQTQHPDGLINQGPDACCRLIEISFKFGRLNEDLAIDITNTCDPRFQHLHPQYRCQSYRRRELCISQMDDAFIRDGEPLASIPGSWTTALKPNSELPVALKMYEHGWQYTDLLEAPYKLWDEEATYEESESESSFSSVVTSNAETPDITDDEFENPREGEDEVEPPNARVGVTGGCPTQRSPRSGLEAPTQNCVKSSRDNFQQSPKFKSPCSGKEAPVL